MLVAKLKHVKKSIPMAFEAISSNNCVTANNNMAIKIIRG